MLFFQNIKNKISINLLINSSLNTQSSLNTTSATLFQPLSHTLYYDFVRPSSTSSAVSFSERNDIPNENF